MERDHGSNSTAAALPGYASFLEATRWVLDVLEARLPGVTPFLAQIDRANNVHRIVDVRHGERFGLRANATLPLGESMCAAMAEDRAPRLSNAVADDAVYGRLELQRLHGIESYLGVPVELFDSSRVASLGAYAPESNRFSEDDAKLFEMLARVLSAELERESHQEDFRHLTGVLRHQANGLARIARVANALAHNENPLQATCIAACEMTGASYAYVLERNGQRFISTAESGDSGPKVKIAPLEGTVGPTFSSLESYFIADAAQHPALDPALVASLNAQSMLFEPIVRDGEIIAVILLVWHHRIRAIGQTEGALLRLLCMQAAAAIAQAGLNNRIDTLALSDPLTGVASKRIWDEQLGREIRRAKRDGSALALALIDLDELSEFNSQNGREEGDRLLKETAAAWAGQLRAIDYIARLDGGQFAVLLPACELGEGCEVLDRIRATTPRGCTASAGVARWEDPEPVELLLARAELALKNAKSHGRNRTLPAD